MGHLWALVISRIISTAKRECGLLFLQTESEEVCCDHDLPYEPTKLRVFFPFPNSPSHDQC